jgi:RNA polymerase primary sigma factor
MSQPHATTPRSPTNPFGLYLRDIRDDALLSGPEEAALARAIAAGDKSARARMIQANLRLVVRIARDYRGRGLTLEDLVGEGNLGLIRASEEFKPEFGTRFCTYASYWIKQAIRNALTNTTATIRLPSHMVSLLAKWRRAERSLARELGQTPTEEQVAVQLGLSDAHFEMIRRALRAGRLQHESALQGTGDGWSVDEAPDDRVSPSDSMEAAEDRQLLLKRLELLDDRERLVVTLRHGLEGNARQTLKEVGSRLGVTREWVRKIELRAVRKLEDSAPPVPAAPGARSRRSLPSNRASN